MTLVTICEEKSQIQLVSSTELTQQNSVNGSSKKLSCLLKLDFEQDEGFLKEVWTLKQITFL